MFRNIKAKNIIFLLNFKMYIFNILIKKKFDFYKFENNIFKKI